MRSGSLAQIIEAWPGKSAHEDGGISQPAVYHMLDVAAVAERLIAPESFREPVRQALILLAALHDLGKISAAFRAMLRHAQPQVAGRHWEVTEAFLRLHDDLLAPTLGSDQFARYELYAATAGHHGRPPSRDLHLNRRNTGPGGEWKAMIDAAGETAVADAAEVIRAFTELWPDACLGSMTSEQARRLSWRLAGLVTTADWIGSNPAWFPPSAPGPLPAAYLAETRERAADAIGKAGIVAPPAASVRPFNFALRSMQTACEQVELPSGPMLALIEDETGSGKTEAGIILAQRMLLEGKAEGLYFALPTMATADAMFGRVADVLKCLYDTAPSLSLAHGRSGLHEGFRELALARDRNPDEPGPTEWLLDSRRKALLADVGVGTVDQALLAVVRAKYAPLRQFGLSRKILVVDEAHEMGDPYMGELLSALLHLHAAQGGSAILMSATLPLELRSRLVAAFETGAGREAPAIENSAYPALTVPGVSTPTVSANRSETNRGPVAVERVQSADQALDLLTKTAGEGAACVWVRNSVDEAIAAIHTLRARGVPAELLHARFALVDRKRHEARILETFGKHRSAHPGQVLIATQVVESSLDLDFDVMVSDLAPMAALIQRAGRLWRHMDLRPAGLRPVDRPTLQVLSPDPGLVTGENWARHVLGQGAYVYALPLLWRTAKVLFEAGEIRVPEGLRDLVEAAHGRSLTVPEVLQSAEFRAEGVDKAQATHAGQNQIDWLAGYRAGASGAEDAEYPTRLGARQKTMVLMRGDAPWSGDRWNVESAQLSEVSASAARLDRLALPEAVPPVNLPRWLTATRCFVTVPPDHQICPGLRYDPEMGLILSSSVNQA
nr:CRISPR-associated helicase Cas3' [Dichotomicrobium thermohalophilum]